MREILIIKRKENRPHTVQASPSLCYTIRGCSDKISSIVKSWSSHFPRGISILHSHPPPHTHIVPKNTLCEQRPFCHMFSQLHPKSVSTVDTTDGAQHVVAKTQLSRMMCSGWGRIPHWGCQSQEQTQHLDHLPSIIA